jgi:nicotinate-nucleotide pyrophosphorylase (carboxylating)
MQRVKNVINQAYMQNLFRRCLEEDGGLHGDVTTNSIISPELQGQFALNVRGQGVFAGLNPIAEAIDVFGNLKISLLHQDGDAVENEKIALLDGSVQAILVAERTILNILGYASGVATNTRAFVDAVAGTNCKICDTRKTTPGVRELDKYAVVCGGGTSHRMGLHDAALFKDNHLAQVVDLYAELNSAIARVRAENELLFVEVEVDTIEQFEQVLLLPVDIILLDNMPQELLKQAVKLRDASEFSPLLEASGGVTLDSVQGIAETGVDRISIGGLVHQATWLDIGLDAL